MGEMADWLAVSDEDGYEHDEIGVTLWCPICMQLWSYDAEEEMGEYAGLDRVCPMCTQEEDDDVPE
jgi:hypothetical protein